MTRPDRCFALFLGPLPASFRDRHDAELGTLLQRMKEELGPSPSRLALLRLYLAVTWDLLRQVTWLGRDARGAPPPEDRGRGAFGGVRFSMLDLRLGGRMLVKHPALTAIATIGVAFAIAVGTVGFEVARQALWPTIPLPDGHAIVALRNWDAADQAVVPASRRDYELWRDGLSIAAR
jgi:hypothetical protein